MNRYYLNIRSVDAWFVKELSDSLPPFTAGFSPRRKKGYDDMSFREALRAVGVRPLINHRVFAPYDHAHNARIDDERYHQRSMTETVNSSLKRSHGSAVRARDWFRQFREIALIAGVHNIEQSIEA